MSYAQPLILDAEQNFSEFIWADGRGEVRQLRHDFEVVRLPQKVDFRRASETLSRLVPAESWTSKYDIPGYQAVSLTGSDPEDIFGEEKYPQSKFAPGGRVIERLVRPPRILESEAYRELGFIWEQFADWNIICPRLMKAVPGCVIPSHTDGAQTVNFHLVLQTNELAACCFGGKLYHLPADGHLYAVNAHSDHHCFNFGSDDRIHLLIGLRRRA